MVCGSRYRIITVIRHNDIADGEMAGQSNDNLNKHELQFIQGNEIRDTYSISIIINYDTETSVKYRE